MRKHILICYSVLLILPLFSVFFPVPTAKAEFIAKNDQERYDYTKKQVTIGKLYKCIDGRREVLEKEISTSSTISYGSFIAISHESCTTYVQAGSPETNLELMATLESVVGNEPIAFLQKLGYVYNSDKTKLVLSVDPSLVPQKFLDAYNGGAMADLNNPDVRYAQAKYYLFGRDSFYCDLRSPIEVSTIRDNSADAGKLAAARNGNLFEGKSYIVISAPGSDGIIETLYHSDVSLSYVKTCRQKASDLKSAADAIISRVSSSNSDDKKAAFQSALKDGMCPASEFQGPGGPSNIDEAGRSACYAKVEKCLSSVLKPGANPDIPTSYRERNEDEITDCLKKQFPAKVALIPDILQAAKKKAEESGNIKLDNPTSGGPGDENKSSCGVAGVGWMVCPATTFIAGLNDAAFGVASKILDVRPELLATSGDNTGAYEAWKAFRDIANAGLVVVFMIVIFSQVSGLGGNGRS